MSIPIENVIQCFNSKQTQEVIFPRKNIISNDLVAFFYSVPIKRETFFPVNEL